MSDRRVMGVHQSGGMNPAGCSEVDGDTGWGRTP